jgi:hypothetical protein
MSHRHHAGGEVWARRWGGQPVEKGWRCPGLRGRGSSSPRQCRTGRAWPRTAREPARDARQATSRDGQPIWTLRLDAIDNERETKETIWVEVAGDEPKLTFDGFAQVRGLVFVPWVGRDGKIRRAFRADAVEPSVPGKAVHAA